MDWSVPLPEAGRQAGASQSWKERGKLGPIPYQTASRLAVTNQVFLGSWTVDIHQEGRSQRSAPQKRHTAHLRCSCVCRKLSGWDRGGDKMHCTWEVCARQAPGRLSCSDLGRAQNAGPTESVPLWSTREPEPEWCRSGSACNPVPASDSSRQSNLKPMQCRPGKHARCEPGQTQ